MKRIERVGIVGFGNFGKFFARKLATTFDVSVWDCRNFNDEAAEMSVRWSTLEEVANRELVVLAVPLQSMELLLGRLTLCVNPNALLMDVCSVKQEPLRLMRKYLPQIELLGTHPLFGPQSAKDGWHGHRLVICPIAASSPKSEFMLQFLRDQGLRLFEMTAEQHDRQMANVQALTHFIARGLTGCEVSNSELATTAFGHLCKVAELLGADSWELFKTIELGNPFAAEVRQRFMQELENLERRLAEQ
ncbi:MAG: prephenate dehydrogenase/arogenate dehydrogenase family protein [Candidatus Doudnabacteria bacterium]|nr:prephenate dehydrogenase/arogenate dehydrogenase family protein [bacterium]MDZ4244152.1 prephenate dehydrogenase/arogenate dehydrogenase family protein [Candidatus Doudnabacteria bacterium]